MYVAIEGIGGAGKGTQIKLLTARLLASGRQPVVFREPGGTLAGEKLRDMLLDKTLELNPMSQLCMFAAARFQLISTIEKEELAGNIVISDRCVATSYAYQGMAMGIGFDNVTRIHKGLRFPDLIIVLDIDAESAVLRRKARDDRYTLDVEFMTHAKLGYLQLAKGWYNAQSLGKSTRFEVINASGTPDEVFERVWKALAFYLPPG